MKRKEFLASLLGIPLVSEIITEEKVVGNVLPDVDKVLPLSGNTPVSYMWRPTGLTRNINGIPEMQQHAISSITSSVITRWVTFIK